MLALASLRHQARRYLAPGIAVVLGVAFVAASLALGSTLTQSIRQSLAGDLDRYAAVVTPGDGSRSLTPAVVDAVRAAKGVGEVTTRRSVPIGIGDDYVLVSDIPRADRGVRLLSGRYPSSSAEIAMSRAAADANDLTLGAQVPVTAYHEGKPHRLIVVGIVDPSADPRLSIGPDVAFATPDLVTAIVGNVSFDEIDVLPAAGADPAGVLQAVRMAAGQGMEVTPGPARVDAMMNDLGSVTKVLTSFLLGFAAVSLFVSAIVIANTFTILLVRRSRETALLRCVGATRRQVVLSTLLESLVLGVMFSVTGLLAGLGIDAGLVALANRFSTTLHLPELSLAVTPVGLVLPVVVGTVVLVFAALWPVVRASKVSPLAALGPDAAVQMRSRAGRVRVGLGVVLVLLGVVGVVLGTQGAGVVVGAAGGFVSFLGVLLAGSVIVPLLVRLVGLAPARALGVPGDLALENTRRNPGRAASTAAALLVGVTLVVLTLVGGQTMERSTTAALDRRYPADVVLSASKGSLPADAKARLLGVHGVQGVSVLPGAELTIGSQPGTRVLGVPDDLRSVLRSSAKLAAVRPGVLVTSTTDTETGLADGQTVTVRGPGGARELRVKVVKGLGFGILLSGADLRALVPRAAGEVAVLRIDTRGDIDPVISSVKRVARTFGEVQVGGSAPERAPLQTGLRVATYVVLALLALSVLIAVIGVANTLSLSVLERRRESALLRALGVTRRQLQGMLALEGALLAVVGGLLGVLLGTVYGLTGISTILASETRDTPMIASIPWGTVGLVLLLALVAGVLASALPGRAAARTEPAAALALD